MPDALRTRVRRVFAVVALTLAWAAVSAGVALVLFLGSSRSVVFASHEALLRPTLTGQVTVHTGPVLPDVRISSGQVVGVDLFLGKTRTASVSELIARYGFIASHPEGQVAKVEDAVTGLAGEAALRGAVVGLLPVLAWGLLGRRRRAEVAGVLRSPRGAAAGAVPVLALAVALWQPWANGDPSSPGQESDGVWAPLTEFVGPGIPLAGELARVEVRVDAMAAQSRRLVVSAVDTYEQSKTWYAEAAAAAAELELRQPEPGETVAVLVADRHDNIGMDQVARAVGDAAGATVVLDAGDDTSTGESWEAFSLDSLDEAFAGYARYAVSGNHDHGSFVGDYLRDLGWTVPDGEIVDGPGGSLLMAADDPRSSGLGNWRDESGLSFAEHAVRVADTACAAEGRVNTLLVHDTNTGREALRRGCVDLVVGGHLHVRQGPSPVVGPDGQRGYTYTTGTAGGAAYAIAVGSKLRRAAEVSLVTYAGGRPVGIQSVLLQTDGRFEVQPYVGLTYPDPAEASASAGREAPPSPP